MTDFCTIADPTQMSRKIKSYRVEKTSSAGYHQMRPIGSTPRYEWTITWDKMSEEDYNTLSAFFMTYNTESFNWTHPTTSTVYEVYFTDADLEDDYVHLCRWNISITISQV